MLAIREESLSGEFTKFYLELPAPFHAVVHRFTGVDKGGPHCHPFSFRSNILYGGYVERVYRLDGSSTLIERKVGDSFCIEATHIHEIVGLPNGECWSIIVPGPHERTTHFWEWRDGQAYSRAWNESTFSIANRYAPEPVILARNRQV